MLYYLFHFLEEQTSLPGASLFSYLSFRAFLAGITSILIGLIFGKRVIGYLRRKQLGETVRELGLEGQKEKEGTPTMGGIIIIMATLIPTFLFAKIHNIYILLLVVSLVWMGLIGGLDDYIKVFKKNKEGLKGKFKVIGQIGLGVLVGAVMYFHPDITIKEKVESAEITQTEVEKLPSFGEPTKSLKTTIPFFKHNEIDYSKALFWMDSEKAMKYAWLIFIPIVIFIVTAVSNGANLTDGIDGLAAGSSTFMVFVLIIFAYLSGNVIFADYLDIMYLPNMGEMTIFAAAFLGGIIGFLWYNTFPAQIFMGDTGSLSIGGVIAVMAIILRKELLIPILCGIFLAENLSVVLQVSYFKYTKKKYGEGKRIFLMSPLHHHYQKKGLHESKIVNRFLIIGALLAVITLLTLKIR